MDEGWYQKVANDPDYVRNELGPKSELRQPRWEYSSCYDHMDEEGVGGAFDADLLAEDPDTKVQLDSRLYNLKLEDRVTDTVVSLKYDLVIDTRKDLANLVDFILELTLLDVRMCSAYCSSHLARAALECAVCEMNDQWNKYEKMRRWIDPLVFILRDLAYAPPKRFTPRAGREQTTEMLASYKKFGMTMHGRVFGRYFDMRKKIAGELVRDDTWSGSEK